MGLHCLLQEKLYLLFIILITMLRDGVRHVMGDSLVFRLIILNQCNNTADRTFLCKDLKTILPRSSMKHPTCVCSCLLLYTHERN
jgi:hypothetical protein